MSRLAQNIPAELHRTEFSYPSSPPRHEKSEQNNENIRYQVHKSSSQSQCKQYVSQHPDIGAKRSSSGIFSLFRWFNNKKIDQKRDEDSSDSSSDSSHEDDDFETRNRNFQVKRDQSSESVDTLFSTATVASFTYVPPAVYRPYGAANPPELFLAPTPETDTHHRRMKQLEKVREQDKNVSLRKKYKLFSSETTTKTNDSSKKNRVSVITHEYGKVITSSLDKNKNKNNVQVSNHEYSELSLPLFKSKNKIMENGETECEDDIKNKKHRRTVSDSCKDKKAGAYCHVKGKRKAPAPPNQNQSYISKNGEDTMKSTLSRKQKRQAPSPPNNEKSNNKETAVVNKQRQYVSSILNKDFEQSSESPSSNLTQEQKDLLITNISKLQSPKFTAMENSTTSVKTQNIMSNDTLKIEHGVLKSVKEVVKQETKQEVSQTKLVAPVSPISPRPWYKRTLSNKENTGSHHKKDTFKYSKSEDYSGLRESKLSNMFSMFSSSSEERRHNENRKSGISILANISELDREAAMIIQKEHNKEQAKLDARNESYYSPSNSQTDMPAFFNMNDEKTPPKSSFKKGSARELISRFNALTNVTRVSMNTSFFSSSKETDSKSNKRFSFAPPENQSDSKYYEKNMYHGVVTPPMKRSIFNLGGFANEEAGVVHENVTKPSNIEKIENDFEIKMVNTSANISKYFEPKNKHNTPPTSLPLEEKVVMPKPNAPPLTPMKPSAPPLTPMHNPQKTIVTDVPKTETNEEEKKNNDTTWVCGRCTLQNERFDTKCTACGFWKPLANIGNIEKYLAPAPAQLNKQKINSEKNGEKESKIYTTETVVTETQFGDDTNIENETNYARSFAENVFKQIEMDEDNDDSVGKEMVINEPNNIEGEPTVEEMRQLRLAKFTQNDKIQEIIPLSPKSIRNNFNYNKPTDFSAISKTQVTVQPNKVMTEEQQKLRKMLKEMKDSLPKKRKSIPDLQKKVNIDPDYAINEDIELRIEEVDETSASTPVPEVKDISKGAIPKVVKEESFNDIKPKIVNEILKKSEVSEDYKNNDKTEILIITQEVSYENIKVRKDNVNANKPIKVSAGSQTQASVWPRIDKKPPKGKEACILPVSVQEISAKSNGGISKSSSFGKGTFELIRPKDFAGITATNTSSSVSPSHTYANISELTEKKLNEDTTPSDKPEMSTSSSLQSISSNIFSEEDVLSAKLSDPEGLKDFKATLKKDKHDATTLAINRLLRRLETAIAGGQHVQAAKLARDLARLKVNCSVTKKKIVSCSENMITADMYVEDQVSHQGPIPLRVDPQMTVADLKQKVAQEFEIPSHVQRWILDRQLANDEESTLEEYNVNFNGCPLFLYLVAPDGECEETLKRVSARVKSNMIEPVPSTSKQNGDIIESSSESESEEINEPESDNEEIEDNLDPNINWRCHVCTLVNTVDRPGCEACSADRPGSTKTQEAKGAKGTTKQLNYLDLIDLDKTDLVPNTEPFECVICMTECNVGMGVVLRECLHTFCKQCLAYTIEYSDEPEIKCPYRDDQYSCELSLQQREVKALVNKEMYEQHLNKSVAQAEHRIDNAFHCKTPDCRGWCIFEDNVNEFHCPVCKATNCLTCQVIHAGLNCQQYQQQLKADSESSAEAARTRAMLDEMVARGEALACPTCHVVLMKKWGCDWLRCSMCKTEICWVTRGPRWGPAGKGDTSGGCKCGVNGIKCHPKCTYCH